MNVHLHIYTLYVKTFTYINIVFKLILFLLNVNWHL